MVILLLTPIIENGLINGSISLILRIQELLHVAVLFLLNETAAFFNLLYDLICISLAFVYLQISILTVLYFHLWQNINNSTFIDIWLVQEF